MPLGSAATTYVQRLLNLNSMKNWIAAGLIEPWQETTHEQEVLASGKLLADYRPK